MTVKKLFTTGGKIILSGIIAFIILTLFCYFYYNIPAHCENSAGSTDFKWESNTFYSRGTEGYAWGRTNNEGYTNMFDYDENMQIDILMMGSSHMEAYEVGMSESTTSRLNSMLENDVVYNIGVTGHKFLNCTCNLEAAIKKYQPAKYVIIETNSLSFSEDTLAHAIDGTMAEIPTYANGIAGFLQKNQFLRLLYKQTKEFMEKETEDANGIEEDIHITNTDASYNDKKLKLLHKLLQKMSTTAENGGVNIIIVYQPGTVVNSDGKLCLEGSQKMVQQFQKLCENNGIIFLDMSSRFEREYKESFTLPHGFCNSSVGSGHLNKYGHSMIADELYGLIAEVE